ncbi:MAG: helix-turn-helix domain-containing protein [Bacteroidota bacterium]
MGKVSNQRETVADAQAIKVQKKLKKIFGHLDPEQPPEVCPIRDILAPVADKWSILIVLFLGGHSKLRFNQLKKMLYGVSSKSLSERLKSLEKDGYLKREMFPEVPIRVEYQLTDFGLAYLEKLLELTEWINLHVPEVVKRRYQFQHLMEKDQSN